MPNIENRLRRIEGATLATELVVGNSQAEIDRQITQLRARGFTGRVEQILIQRWTVSPPPRDAAGKITGPALEPYLYVPEARS